MRHLDSPAYPNWGQTARSGAGFAVRLTIAYAVVFIVYALVRSVLRLLPTPTFDAGLVGTLLAYGVSLALPALVIALILALVMTLLGIVTALIVRGLLSVLNPTHAPLSAILVGAAVALVIAALLHVGLGFSPDSLTWETYLFWVGIPSAIYVIVGAVGSWRLCAPLSAA